MKILEKNFLWVFKDESIKQIHKQTKKLLINTISAKSSPIITKLLEKLPVGFQGCVN